MLLPEVETSVAPIGQWCSSGSLSAMLEATHLTSLRGLSTLPILLSFRFSSRLSLGWKIWPLFFALTVLGWFSVKLPKAAPPFRQLSAVMKFRDRGWAISCCVNIRPCKLCRWLRGSAYPWLGSSRLDSALTIALPLRLSKSFLKRKRPTPHDDPRMPDLLLVKIQETAAITEQSTCCHFTEFWFPIWNRDGRQASESVLERPSFLAAVPGQPCEDEISIPTASVDFWCQALKMRPGHAAHRDLLSLLAPKPAGLSLPKVAATCGPGNCPGCTTEGLPWQCPG